MSIVDPAVTFRRAEGHTRNLVPASRGGFALERAVYPAAMARVRAAPTSPGDLPTYALQRRND